MHLMEDGAWQFAFVAGPQVDLKFLGADGSMGLVPSTTL